MLVAVKSALSADSPLTPGVAVPSPLLLASGWAYPPARLLPLVRALAARAVAVIGSAESLRGRLAAARTPCWLAGWSLGGLLAIEAALEQPQLVRGLILIGTTARFCRDEGYPAGQPVPVVRAMLRALSTGAETMLDTFFRLAARPESPAEADIGGAVSEALASGRENLRAGLTSLLRTDLRESLRALERPVLVLHGGSDEIIPPGAGLWLADHLPRATMRIHPGAGHELPLRQAEWVAGAVNEFIARREAAAPGPASSWS